MMKNIFILFVIFFSINSFADKAEEEHTIAQTGSFKTETCKWVSDMPRRLIFGPGCNSGRNAMLCTGFVVCNATSGGKFIRQSTCGSDNCGDDKAVACTKQANFGSCKPESETKTGISDRTTEALTIED